MAFRGETFTKPSIVRELTRHPITQEILLNGHVRVPTSEEHTRAVKRSAPIASGEVIMTSGMLGRPIPRLKKS